MKKKEKIIKRFLKKIGKTKTKSMAKKQKKTIKEDKIKKVKEIEKKLVFRGTEIVIFEGGYWIKREDYDKCFLKDKVNPNPNIFLDIDKSTRQIRIGYFPN